MTLTQVPFRTQYWDLESWKELGFSSIEEAEYWQGSTCGILCLGMVIEKITNLNVSNKDLIEKGLSLGAYSDKLGWSHDGLVKLSNTYNLNAESREGVTVDDLKNILEDNNLFIASIKWAFLPNKTFIEKLLFWRKKGGHLTLVTGYDDTGFFVHHTSIKESYNWQDAHIPFKKFSDGFTSRGISISL